MTESESPNQQTVQKIWNYAKKYSGKVGLGLNTVAGVAEAVVMGLADNIDTVGKPLCPCNFYSDKEAEVKHRRWLCPCDEMQIYKYCHCMLFVGSNNMPITEHLPEEHEGRQMYGINQDPAPEQGRALRNQATDDLDQWYNQ